MKAGQFAAAVRQVPKEYSSTLSSLQDQVLTFVTITLVFMHCIGCIVVLIYLIPCVIVALYFANSFALHIYLYIFLY